MNDNEPQFRVWGQGSRTVVLVHGGPAAPGTMAPVAYGLAEEYRVIEAFQRGSGAGGELTVGHHVADLHALVVGQCDNCPTALVGHSWGAMLALAFAAEHPEMNLPLVLVGCGTFDPVARAEFNRRRQERHTPEMRSRELALERDQSLSEGERMSRRGAIADEVYTFSRRQAGAGEPSDDLIGPFDLEAHRQTWDDELRLQSQGLHPAAFAKITAAVLMIHGREDPHPGTMIRDSLLAHVPQLEYLELPQCGHSPWNEQFARDDFFLELRR